MPIARFPRLALAAAAALTLAAAGCDVADLAGPATPGGATPGGGAPGGSAPGGKAKATPRPGAAQPGIPLGANATSGNAAAIGATGKPGKLLLAMYVMGSDLEDDVLEPRKEPDEQTTGELNKNGAATSDFGEILDAIGKLSEAERANIEVLALFGGARQTGWKGTKLIDLKGLIKDGEDGYFGNASPDTYLAVDEGAEMGNPAVFRKFLQDVQARQGDAAKTFLDIWDHGGSFMGMGPDMVARANKGDAQLTTDEIRDTLGATSFRSDLIGFDACLMGSVEVVASVRGHADYLVASEETEPGHGWDYSLWVEKAAKQPAAGSADIGKWIVDSFLDSPRHKVTSGRTLSVINLEKAGTLLAATDALAGVMQEKAGSSLDTILDANRQAQKYGSHGKDDDEFSRDLKAFVDALAKQDPSIAAAADGVKSALQSCVVYSREDGTKPGSTGLAVYSFTNPLFFERNFYNAKTASSAGWFGFVQAVNTAASGDAEAPTIAESAKGYHLQHASGTDLKVEDKLGVKNVSALHVIQPDLAKNEYIVLESEDLKETAENVFHMDPWDGYALHFTDAAGTKSLVPTDVADVTPEGWELWTTVCRWNGEDATLWMAVDKEATIQNTWIVPFEVNEAGDTVIAREQYELADGDTFAFYRQLIDTDKNEERYEPGPTLTFDADLQLTWEKVQGKGYYFGVAEDLKGNQTNTPVREVP